AGGAGLAGRRWRRASRGSAAGAGRADAGVDAAGARAFGAEAVVGVGEGAAVEGEAAAADAVGEVVAEPLELLDAVVELAAPGGRQVGPVVAGRGAAFRQFGEGRLDGLERYAEPLGEPDEGDPAEGVAGVTALVARRAPAADQALRLVEVQGRHGDAAALGELADGEFSGVPDGLGHELDLT